MCSRRGCENAPTTATHENDNGITLQQSGTAVVAAQTALLQWQHNSYSATDHCGCARDCCGDILTLRQHNGYSATDHCGCTRDCCGDILTPRQQTGNTATATAILITGRRDSAYGRPKLTGNMTNARTQRSHSSAIATVTCCKA